MGTSYFATPAAIRAQQSSVDLIEAQLDRERKLLAAKIVMAVTDKIINEIVRPGPKPEERECYEMAGELRAIVPDLEDLAAQIIKVDEEGPR